MIYKFFYYILSLFPSLKRFFWKFWYTRFSSKIKNPNLRFMNYGYFKKDLIVDINDDINKYPTQLYHYLASQSEIGGKNVLEIGSGRGGGAFYIARTFKPKKMIALDISPTAIDLCNKIYDLNNLEYCVGDAQKLNFNDNFFDVVINVESSHCYPNMDIFLNEVNRVLKPNGHFLFADLRRSYLLDSMFKKFDSANFKTVKKEDITQNILQASDLMSDQRKKMIAKNYPSFLHSIFESFAAVKGSKVYNSFSEGYLKYVLAVFKNR